jgi:PAS domain S-box-containing protein
MTHLTLFMYNLRTPALPDDIERALAALRKRGSIAMEIPDQVHVHGYALLHDIESQPALVLRVEMPRDIYIRGSNAIDYFLLTLLVIALVSVTSLMLLIGKLLSSLQKNREVEQRYQSVVRQSGEGIILVDAQDGHLLDANAAFCRLLGYRAEEVMGLLLKDLLNCNEDAVKRYLNQILSESRHVTSEEQYRRKDGAWLDVEIGAYVVFHADKNVVCIMVRDITERKSNEQRIKYLAHYDALTFQSAESYPAARPFEAGNGARRPQPLAGGSGVFGSGSFQGDQRFAWALHRRFVAAGHRATPDRRGSQRRQRIAAGRRRIRDRHLADQG